MFFDKFSISLQFFAYFVILCTVGSKLVIQVYSALRCCCRWDYLRMWLWLLGVSLWRGIFFHLFATSFFSRNSSIWYDHPFLFFSSYLLFPVDQLWSSMVFRIFEILLDTRWTSDLLRSHRYADLINRFHELYLFFKRKKLFSTYLFFCNFFRWFILMIYISRNLFHQSSLQVKGNFGSLFFVRIVESFSSRLRPNTQIQCLSHVHHFQFCKIVTFLEKQQQSSRG